MVIRNGTESSTTIRVDLDKLIPHCDKQLVIFVSSKNGNGNGKHKQTILDEWTQEVPSTTS